MPPRLPSATTITPACILSLVLCGCGREPAPEALIAGLVTDGRLGEISGLAASPVQSNLLWAIDDSGNPARLYALTRRGQLRASYAVDGIAKTDWEDIAAFQLDGKSYLLVADTGDNGGIRKILSLHVFPEPADADHDGHVSPAWSIRFRWPDGARDCEAVAIDAERGEILLISKKRQPPQLFLLPLRPGNGKPDRILTARLAGTLAGVPQASARERAERPAVARLRSQVTAADIAPGRDAIAVLTYDNLLIYSRPPGQAWPRTLAHPPRWIVPMLLLPQGEAATWSRDGEGIYASGEFNPAPIFYVTYPRPD